MALRRFDALDSLRGLAALAVVLNHCLNLFPAVGGVSAGQQPHLPGPFTMWLLRSPLSLAWQGRGAVALFFVLSGFVLALPWFGHRAQTYGSFVIRRLCRIYLPYAVAVGLAMILATSLAALRPPPLSLWFDTANWTEPVSWAAIFDQVLMLGAHNSFDNAVWSLDYEMRISLIFPLLLLPILWFGVRGAIALGLGMLIAAVAMNHFGGWHGPSAALAATLQYGSFFVLGAALARYAEVLAAGRCSWQGNVSDHLAAWAALAAGLTLLWAGRGSAALAAGSGLLILAAILPSSIRDALSWRSLRELGRISYSLYLTHLLVILSAVYLLHGRLPLSAIAAGACVTAVPIAWLFNRWVEEPTNRFGRLLSGRRSARPALLVP